VAIRTDGTLWAWGNNSHGQLGDGTTTQRNAPVRIGSDSNWASVSAGWQHTLAVRTDGTLWAWGNNADDWRLGAVWDGDMTYTTTPIQVGTDSNWASVSAGGRHTVAVRTDGSLWTWGFNQFGQLGDGTTVGRFAPVRIGTDNNWASVSAGDSHTVAIRMDGSLWAWGGNGQGRLGDGTTTSRASPVRVMTLAGWVPASISAGSSFGTTVGRDGTIFAWGWNGQGGLGDGTTSNSSFPIRVVQ